MAQYTIYDSEGNVVQIANVDPENIESLVGEGQFYTDAISANPEDKIDLNTMTVIRGKMIEPPEPMPAPEIPAYVTQRNALYPTIANQLDMLFHAMDNGEIPKATTFYNRIKAVKTTVPKDTVSDPAIIANMEPIPEDEE